MQQNHKNEDGCMQYSKCFAAIIICLPCIISATVLCCIPKEVALYCWEPLSLDKNDCIIGGDECTKEGSKLFERTGLSHCKEQGSCNYLRQHCDRMHNERKRAPFPDDCIWSMQSTVLLTPVMYNNM
jgi:hypothetical protein